MTSAAATETELTSELFTYRSIVETANEGIWIIDSQGNTTFVNQRMAQMLGYSVEQFLGSSMFDFMDDGAKEDAQRNMVRRSAGFDDVHDFRFQHQDGSDRWFIIGTKSIIDGDGAFKGALGMLTDITERKRAEKELMEIRQSLEIQIERRTAELEQSNRQLIQRQRAIDASAHGIVIGKYDESEFVIDYANAASMWMTGFPSEAAVGRPWQELVRYDAESGEGSKISSAIANGKDGNAIVEIAHDDGSCGWYDLHVSAVRDCDGKYTHFVLASYDITSLRQSEERIEHLAFFDPLTNLPNRRMLMDRLGMLVVAAERSGEVFAVLFIDLDHFKNVNDARGHATGDTLLQLVAERLQGLMRAEDTVARIGGDEFVLLLQGLPRDSTKAVQQAMAIAEKLREALAQPLEIHGLQYASGASIGVTVRSTPGQTADDLLREADTAMYRAKRGGRNRIAFFEITMHSEAENRLALVNDLAQAFGTDQLEMLIQPQFDLQGRAAGGEMLMRWTHPVLGQISPNNFIPAAEESGLILLLGDWALREGCLAILRLESSGMPMPISINVSPRQFHQSNFVDRVQKVLYDTGAPATKLIFEVTEGLLIDNVDETVQRMHELVTMGIRFSIDDFGTGYSSLGYLHKLPLYELKIDRSFVQNTPTDPGPTAIVQSILSMAQHLGLNVVAEGVETEAQAAFLRTAGCTQLQGFLLARPMRLETWLQRDVLLN